MVRGAAEQAGSMEEFKQGLMKLENIIRTIDNIAFQTNILVLNTAVEATVNRITLCFCPAGIVSLPACHASWFSFSSSCRSPPYGFRAEFLTLIAPAHAEKAPVPHVDGDEQRFPAVSDIHPHHLAPTRERLLALPGPAQSPSGKDQTPSASLLYRSAWGSRDHKSSSDNRFRGPVIPLYSQAAHQGLMLRWNLVWTAEDRSGRPAAGSR